MAHAVQPQYVFLVGVRVLALVQLDTTPYYPLHSCPQDTALLELTKRCAAIDLARGFHWSVTICGACNARQLAEGIACANIKALANLYITQSTSSPSYLHHHHHHHHHFYRTSNPPSPLP